MPCVRAWGPMAHPGVHHTAGDLPPPSPHPTRNLGWGWDEGSSSLRSHLSLEVGVNWVS